MIAAETRSALKRSLWRVMWLATAGAAAIAALLMAAAALFVWVYERFDPVAACLAVTALFAAIATASAVIAMLCRQPTPLVSETRRPGIAAWIEPSIVAAGLDIVRTLGGKRATTLAIGALVTIWILNKSQTSSRR